MKETEYLEMADGCKVNSDEGMFEHFDTENIIEHFTSGRLAQWLKAKQAGRDFNREYQHLISLHKNSSHHHRLFDILFRLCDDCLRKRQIEQADFLAKWRANPAPKDEESQNYYGNLEKQIVRIEDGLEKIGGKLRELESKMDLDEWITIRRELVMYQTETAMFMQRMKEYQC